MYFLCCFSFKTTHVYHPTYVFDFLFEILRNCSISSHGDYFHDQENFKNEGRTFKSIWAYLKKQWNRLLLLLVGSAFFFRLHAHPQPPSVWDRHPQPFFRLAAAPTTFFRLGTATFFPLGFTTTGDSHVGVPVAFLVVPENVWKMCLKKFDWIPKTPLKQEKQNIMNAL